MDNTGEIYDLREEKAVELAVFLGQDWTQNLFLACSSTQKSNKSTWDNYAAAFIKLSVNPDNLFI